MKRIVVLLYLLSTICFAQIPVQFVPNNIPATKIQGLSSAIDTEIGTTWRSSSGSGSGNVKVAYITPSYPDERPMILDLVNNTLYFEPYTFIIFRSDNLQGNTYNGAAQTINFSAISTGVSIIYNSNTNSFRAVTSNSAPSLDANDYFVTSFTKVSDGRLVEPSFNTQAIVVKSASDDKPNNWTILGDSHTEGGVLWVNETNRLLGYTMTPTRLGLSGSTITNNSENSFYARRTSISANTDLLTIFGGTNDAGGSYTIGTIASSGFNNATFIGSLQAIIEYAYSINPNMRIHLMSPTWYYESGVKNTTLDNYVTAMQQVADFYGIPHLSLSKNLGINAINQTTFLSDEMHFNDAGRRLLARQLANFIKDKY